MNMFFRLNSVSFSLIDLQEGNEDFFQPFPIFQLILLNASNIRRRP